MIDYMDAHRDQFGVEPICRVLAEHGVPIAPSSYRAARARPPSSRALRDAALAEVIEATFWDRDKGRGVYGARKMWHQLRPDGSPVARARRWRAAPSSG